MVVATNNAEAGVSGLSALCRSAGELFSHAAGTGRLQLTAAMGESPRRLRSLFFVEPLANPT
jgi:hypothetical protein